MTNLHNRIVKEAESPATLSHSSRFIGTNNKRKEPVH